jgi:DNA-binding response OmpR family regulator
MHFFLIDADAITGAQYTAALQRRGTVDCFQTASAAIRALNTVIPDVVVMELALPEHNGLEFLYELRSYSDTRRTSVIVLSMIRESAIPYGYVTPADLGIVRHLYKPSTTPAMLLEIVDETP